MDSAEAQAQQEVAQVVRIVDELTGLPSRWGGWVELMPKPNYKLMLRSPALKGRSGGPAANRSATGKI